LKNAIGKRCTLKIIIPLCIFLSKNDDCAIRQESPRWTKKHCYNISFPQREKKIVGLCSVAFFSLSTVRVGWKRGIGYFYYRFDSGNSQSSSFSLPWWYSMIFTRLLSQLLFIVVTTAMVDNSWFYWYALQSKKTKSSFLFWTVQKREFGKETLDHFYCQLSKMV